MIDELFKDIVVCCAYNINFNNNYNGLFFDKFDIDILKNFIEFNISTDKNDLKFTGKLKELDPKDKEEINKISTNILLKEIQLQKNQHILEAVSDKILKFVEDIDLEDEDENITKIDLEKCNNPNVKKVLQILRKNNFNFNFELSLEDDFYYLEAELKKISMANKDLLVLIDIMKYCENFYIVPIYNFNDENDENCYGIRFSWEIGK